MLKKSQFFSVLCVLLFLGFSCKEKSFEEYNENEFYQVQGVIISSKMTSSIADSPFMKEIKYEYFINDSLLLENSEDFSFMDMEKGIPIEVLVHKEDPNISFYWRNGFSDNITPYQTQYVKEKLERAMSEIESDLDKR